MSGRLTPERLEAIKWNLGHGSEIDALFAYIDAIEEEFVRDRDGILLRLGEIEAENTRLRAALERIAAMRMLDTHTRDGSGATAAEVARAALDGEPTDAAS